MKDSKKLIETIEDEYHLKMDTILRSSDEKR